MAPFVLKFKGNKSFSPFSNLADADSLTKTWKVCTKVAAHLEQGQRLENLSWRMWHLQNVMVDSDNAKSRREFKKLSKNMGERLDKDKGRSIEELEVPDFKGSEVSLDKLKRRAEERERGIQGRSGMKGMTFTFPADPTTNRTPGATAAPVALAKKPQRANPLKDEHDDALNGGLIIDTSVSSFEKAATPTSSSVKLNRTHYRNHHDSISSVSSEVYNARFAAPPSPPTSNGSGGAQRNVQHSAQPVNVIRFPNIFDDGFSPTALLCPAPSVKQSVTYGEAIGFAGLSSSSAHADVFSVSRPTFEFPLDDLMTGDGGSDGDASTTGWNADGDSASALTNSVSSLSIPTPVSASMASFRDLQITHADAMQGIQQTGIGKESLLMNSASIIDVDLDGDELIRKSPPQSAPASPAIFAVNGPSANPNIFQSELPPPPLTLPKGAALPGPSPTPSPAPAPAHRIPRRYSTTNAPNPSESSKKSGRHPSATAPRTIRASYGNSAPGGVKSECANCGANSTPLWRRGLNDELNCNACGLFAKLHKRPRPKSLRNSVGEGGTRNPGWATTRNGDETGEPVSCYNCATIATPLWRKDEEGRTLCNACGLYLKLHGEKRPSSMKSDVIRKRSRHDVRRGQSSSATPSASPGASRRTSPTPPITQNGEFVVPQQQHSPSEHQQQSARSPYDQGRTNGALDFTGNVADNSPVDLMSMNHTMVTEGGVDPALGGMTFSPGLTYTEGLQYPGPLSLSYYFAQYGGEPGQNIAQQQQQQQPQQQKPPQQQERPTTSQDNASDPRVSPILHSAGSPQTSPGNGPLFGPSAHHSTGESSIDGSPWDHGFQMGYNPTFSFNYSAAASMADAAAAAAAAATQNSNGETLGVVHPPMLPWWYSDGAKPEPDHDITFGH